MERLAAHERRGLAGDADGELDLARGRAPAHGVVAIVGAVEIVVSVDVQAVRALEHALAPGAQEVALAVEHDHRVLAAIEDVDLVLAVHGDGADVHELPSRRAAWPSSPPPDSDARHYPTRPTLKILLLFVIPVLVTGIHRAACSGVQGELDPGHKAPG
jgi:hypothetical protein